VNAAIYARVSTSDQTCAMQLKELRAYVKARGWKVAGEYVDTGWSGAKASRPELDRLMQDARGRKVDAILVWKLDRWGRSVANLVASLQELHALGIRWIATTQGLDTDQSSPVGRLLIHMLSAVAEFERSLAQERIRAGISAAKTRGVHCGRPRKVVDRLRVAEMRAQGVSFRAIARQLGISLAKVQRTVSLIPPRPKQAAVSKPRKRRRS
jgi:DNA invertase Pin-like site-specific DNA recombinase